MTAQKKQEGCCSECLDVRTTALRCLNRGCDCHTVVGGEGEGTWISQFVEVDGVAVCVRRDNEKWKVIVSGSKEYILSLDFIGELLVKARQEGRIEEAANCKDSIIDCHHELADKAKAFLAARRGSSE